MGFDDLLEAMPDALVGVDRSGVIRFVNRHTESLFGYERDDLVGVPLETLVPESVRQVHVAHRRGYEAAPRSRPMGADLNLRGRRRDGATFPVKIALSPMGTGDDMSVIAVVRDMTHDRSVEADGRRNERLLAIVEYSDEAIITATLEGIITSWNPAAEKIFGYCTQEIVGKSNELLTPPDRCNEMMAIRVKVRAGPSVEHLQTMRVRKDGRVFAVSLSVSPIHNADGAVVGTSTIIHDRSEMR